MIYFISLSLSLSESTQTVQALQYPNSDAPPGTKNKEVEIRSLNNEIDLLKKQISGQTRLHYTATLNGFSPSASFSASSSLSVSRFHCLYFSAVPNQIKNAMRLNQTLA